MEENWRWGLFKSVTNDFPLGSCSLINMPDCSNRSCHHKMLWKDKCCVKSFLQSTFSTLVFKKLKKHLGRRSFLVKLKSYNLRSYSPLHEVNCKNKFLKMFKNFFKSYYSLQEGYGKTILGQGFHLKQKFDRNI